MLKLRRAVEAVLVWLGVLQAPLPEVQESVLDKAVLQTWREPHAYDRDAWFKRIAAANTPYVMTESDRVAAERIRARWATADGVQSGAVIQMVRK